MLPKISVLLVALVGLSGCQSGAPGHFAESETSISRIVIAGDSTAADYPDYRAPQTGWGQALPYFLGSDVEVLNLAVNGRSTKSYLDEGRWAELIAQTGPGDLVLISFGHNDSRDDDPARYTAPLGAYQDNLRRFVEDVRSTGARPMIVSPAARRLWEGPAMVETHGLYAHAAEHAAILESADFINLSILSLAYFEGLGREESKRDFFWVTRRHWETGELETLEDNTHFTYLGACGVAFVVAGALEETLEGVPNMGHMNQASANSLRPQRVLSCEQWLLSTAASGTDFDT